MGCEAGRGKRSTEVGLYCMIMKGKVSRHESVRYVCLRHGSIPTSRCAFSYGLLVTKLIDLHTAERSAGIVASSCQGAMNAY